MSCPRQAPQELPEDCQGLWREHKSLQALEIELALQSAACGLVYYRAGPDDVVSDDDGDCSRSGDGEAERGAGDVSALDTGARRDTGASGASAHASACAAAGEREAVVVAGHDFGTAQPQLGTLPSEDDSASMCGHESGGDVTGEAGDPGPDMLVAARQVASASARSGAARARRPGSAGRHLRAPGASQPGSAAATPLHSARSGESAGSASSSVGAARDRHDLLAMQDTMGHLVENLMARAVPGAIYSPSGFSTPADTARSVGGSLAGSEDMRHLCGQATGVVDDVVTGVLGACTDRTARSDGSSVATLQAREELVRVEADQSQLVDEVLDGVVDRCQTERTVDTDASGGTARSDASSVATDQAREELANIGGNVSAMLDGVMSGVVQDFPSARSPLHTERGPASARSRTGRGPSRTPRSPHAPGSARSRALVPSARSVRKGTCTPSEVGSDGDRDSAHTGTSEAEALADVTQQSQASLWNSAALRDAGDFATGGVPNRQSPSEQVNVLQEGLIQQHTQPRQHHDTQEGGGGAKPAVDEDADFNVFERHGQHFAAVGSDEALLKRERRLLRGYPLHVCKYKVTFVAAQSRPSTATDAAAPEVSDQVGEGQELTQEWDPVSAAAAAAAGVGRDRIPGSASWKQVKSAIQVSAAFAANWQPPPNRVSPESLADFAQTVRRDLRAILDQVCSEWGQAEPMQTIVHRERSRTLQKLAAQSPQVARLRAGMGPEKTRRMVERAARRQHSAVTRPTFQDMVSWRCHQKLWRRRSKHLLRDGGRTFRQLLSEVCLRQHTSTCLPQ